MLPVLLRMQSRRRVGAGTGEVALVASVEEEQIELLIDEVVQDTLEGARMQLPFEIDGDEARAGVDGFVAGHGIASEGNTLMTLDIPDGSRQDALMNELFLHPRYAFNADCHVADCH
ncbi:MAG: hypothetical protein A2045_15185 [Rhodocyclales bacterium GWA2_65_20]|nr:MAG: hypothetical protein A2045_15185 [Rhodocyclales bacterium GWA2_65_20]